MAVRREFPKLRQRLGDDGMLELHGMLEDTGREWREDVLHIAGARFERRVIEEAAALRLEIAAVRLEIATSRNSLLKWMFACWASAILAIVLK